MDNWVLVVDDDPTSTRQLDVCRRSRVEMGGFIECHAPENHDAPICQAVEYFPAFCHKTERSCVYGVRDTQSALEELTTLVPTPQTKSKSHSP